MPPLVIPPLAKIALGTLGAGAVLHWALKAVRRIDREFDAVTTTPSVDPIVRQSFPTLRRDPDTGDWRVM